MGCFNIRGRLTRCLPSQDDRHFSLAPAEHGERRRGGAGNELEDKRVDGKGAGVVRGNGLRVTVI